MPWETTLKWSIASIERSLFQKLFSNKVFFRMTLTITKYYSIFSPCNEREFTGCQCTIKYLKKYFLLSIYLFQNIFPIFTQIRWKMLKIYNIHKQFSRWIFVCLPKFFTNLCFENILMFIQRIIHWLQFIIHFKGCNYQKKSAPWRNVIQIGV